MSYFFKMAGAEDMPQVYQLLKNVFRPTYGTILTEQQMVWMLDNIFSESALCQQQANPAFRFILLFQDAVLSGFSAIEQNVDGRRTCCKMHKLYLSVESQGLGMGRMLLTETEKQACILGQQQLILNVNRHNKARYFYEKMGFEVLYEEDIPLENGYFMNDFVMGKTLGGL